MMLTKKLRVVGLISGGKDSCYNMIQCVSEGHTIVALANLRPKDKDEADSYMFQTVGHHMIGLYGQAFGVPLYRRTLQGSSLELGADYSTTKDDEVEDLYELLKEVKEKEEVNAVSVGAILSDYQRVRVEHVCMRLGLTPLAYLWRRDPAELLGEMVRAGVESILIKVAALGLDPHKHLGQTLAQILPHMVNMESKFGLNVCGEGGEYETFTLDCPLFTKRIIIDKQELVIHSDDAFSPVGYLNILEAHLEEKQNIKPNAGLHELQIHRSLDLVKELFADGSPEEFECTATEEGITNTPVAELTASPDLYIHVSRMSSGHFWVTGVMGWVIEGQCLKVMTSKAMDSLSDQLASMDVELKDVVLMQLYVSNMDEFTSINQVYKQYFTLNPPARLCLQVALPSNVGLRIACYGYRPPGGVKESLCRRTMHVQGLSHWAPANIGPYSQAVRLGDTTTYVAGQIGMVPSTLDLVSGLTAQCRLSLRHVSRVLAALSPATYLHHVIVGVCYVTRPTHTTTATSQFNTALKESLSEIGTDAESSRRLLPNIQYMVVPRLPKGALVEWQVYTASCENILSGEVQRQSGDLEGTLQYKYLPTPYDLLSYTITIDRHSTPTDQVEYQEVVQLVYNVLIVACDKLTTCLPVEEKNQILSRCVQIFYIPGEVSENQLRQCFQLMSSLPVVLPVPVFVPVMAFTSNSRLMTLCC